MRGKRRGSAARPLFQTLGTAARPLFQTLGTAARPLFQTLGIYTFNESMKYKYILQYIWSCHKKDNLYSLESFKIEFVLV